MAGLTLDHLIIAVADLGAAVDDWSALLGRGHSWRGTHPAMGTSNALFRFGEGYLELLAADPAASAPLASMVREVLGERDERPFGLALGTSDIDARVAKLRAGGVAVLDPAAGEGVESTSGARRTWRSALLDPRTVRGLRMLVIEHTSPTSLLPVARPLDGDEAALASGLDHVVVFTADLAASCDLWVRAFGLEVAWSRDFPERGTKNLGLRLGDVTLELIHRREGRRPSPPSGQARRGPLFPLASARPRAPRAESWVTLPVERTARTGATAGGPASAVPGSKGDRDDFLWGAAWRVGDCARAVARIAARGYAVDPPRPGLADGTSVATVRWSRTPTLMLAPS